MSGDFDPRNCDSRDAMFDVRESDLRHLKDEGLIQRVSLDGRDRAVALTDRQSGEAAKWEQELVELQKNLRQLPQNCHKLVKSARQRKSENDVTARKPSHLGA